jgi:oxepin-CoA hydrolase / 3-oxo-5,6-dehydrosuberyl-CoA semialdehyde dehydrogenase
MGPLVSLSQRAEVLGRVKSLEAESERVTPAPFVPRAADPDRGAFVPPTLLYCREPSAARAVHTLEAFGPVCTVLPYEGTDAAIALARRGEGSLAASVFTADDRIARQLALGLAPLHGRLLFVNRHCAKESTGHGSPLPQLVHGGPGRAGGGEELGGIRGLSHYLQRTALQGAPDTLTAIVGRFMPGATPHISSVHPFRKPFHELAIGDSFLSPYRIVTVEDIERFADLSGDRFYAHMDEIQAQRNPFFGGRVAHGYFLISAAAGLFVDPGFGPVLANYGLDNLRFLKPVRPGDQIRVRLSCKDKSLRAGSGYGEVRWDTEITNQRGERVASYDVLTMVSEEAEPTPGARPA